MGREGGRERGTLSINSARTHTSTHAYTLNIIPSGLAPPVCKKLSHMPSIGITAADTHAHNFLSFFSVSSASQ